MEEKQDKLVALFDLIRDFIIVGTCGAILASLPQIISYLKLIYISI